MLEPEKKIFQVRKGTKKLIFTEVQLEEKKKERENFIFGFLNSFYFEVHIFAT